MSYEVGIMSTKFVDVNVTHKESYGVRVFDKYQQTYDNSWNEIPKEKLDILQKVLENEDEVVINIIDFVLEEEEGIWIDEKYFEWNEIKHLFEDNPPER